MPDPARLAAYDVLRAVRTEDAYANLVLPQQLRAHALSGRDAAFATELASGTLRRRATWDAVIDACLTGKVQPRVRDVVRLGVHQLLAMRVGDHAAVSTSVDLARARTGPRSGGLVNAVLRKVSTRDLDGWLDEVAPDPATDPVGHLAVVHSHPRWVVEELARALGDERAEELPVLLAADNDAPAVVLVARPGLATRDELPGEPTSFSPYGVRLAGGDPGAVPAVAEGRAGVQDEGSQLVALAVAGASVEGRDERWLDLCAGPGGKAALLGALAHERGATLTANEPQPHRADLVRRSLRVVPGAPEVTSYDGREGPWAPATFDRVLVDAPCSGLGALRRRPEARWRKQPTDLDELVPLQRALLTRALELVRPGGVVVYATCSPVLAETVEVVEGVLEGRDDVRRGETRQLWPHEHGTDAMSWSVLTRW
ncbi:transcription antitermination factor NusB [Nocardioides aestuarii]|uniref:RsmB/NOP family class I SAM-dependent RNA methyltransferase n=1 Tax=Nocardioides aestuarii TaxID=252231 RepID=A0ABW4THY7_9ACTN